VDNIFRATPFWWWLVHGKGKVREEIGGRFIGIQLLYAKNNTVAWISTYGVVDTTPQDNITTATDNWRYIAGSVARSGIEEQQNQGKNAIFNMVQAKLEGLQMSIIDNIETNLFVAQTGDLINGLPSLVDSTPDTARTVQGLAQTTHTWWKNKQQTFAGSFAVNGLTEMTNFYNDVSEGADHPDLLLTDQTTFELYEAEMRQFLQLGSTKMGDAGFEALRFKGADVVWSSQATAAAMYFLNSRYLELVIDPTYYFEMTDWKAVPEQVEDKVAQVIAAMNLVTSNRRRLGVLTAIPTA